MKTITPRELHAVILAQPETTVIDVRTPVEYESMHLIHARNIPLTSLKPRLLFEAGRVSQVQPIYLLCRTGTRATLAAQQFTTDGFENTVLVDGGIFSVVRRLQEEVRKRVRVGDPRKPTGRTEPIMAKFTRALPIVRELLQTDVQAAYEGDPSALSSEEIILSFPFVEAIAIQRLAHRLHREGAPIIPRMMTEWAHARTGIDIHPGAQIGSHFFIDHGTGVVIGETCQIGNHVKLYHGVTLGARSFQKDDSGNLVKGTKRHPNVEDHVTIYPNSTILGGETVIGENSTIGANVFLMHSVPPNSLVIYREKNLSVIDKTAKGQISAGDFSI